MICGNLDFSPLKMLSIPTGSDFVTAPELTPLFGQTLAKQIAQALQHTQTTEIWEFGAGSGALALQLLSALEQLGQPVTRYTIVDLSGSLRQRQQETLLIFGDKVRWVSELPDAMQGVVVGNEVLDAMPVKLLARVKGSWYERGVITKDGQFDWQDRPTELRPPLEIMGEHDYLTEIHPQAEAFMRTLAHKLTSSDQGRRGVFHRLWLSRSRIFPPAAPHGHGHVPPRPQGRWRPAGASGAQRHHRARQLHGRGCGGAG